MGWQRGLITPNDGHTVIDAEYMDDYRWNGWLCPRMSFEQAERILRDCAAEAPEDFMVMLDGETFYLWEYNYEMDEGYEPEIHAPDNGFYYVGSMSWCWSLAGEVPRTTFEVSFIECPDCGTHRVETGHATNRHNEAYLEFSCGNPDCEPLASIDIQVEWNEDWTVALDADGQHSLAVRTYDDLPSADVLGELGVSMTAINGPVTWQEAEAAFGAIAVLEAMAKAGEYR